MCDTQIITCVIIAACSQYMYVRKSYKHQIVSIIFGPTYISIIYCGQNVYVWPMSPICTLG